MWGGQIGCSGESGFQDGEGLGVIIEVRVSGEEMNSNAREITVELVDLVDIPPRQNSSNAIWVARFDRLPEGKAGMLCCNNRQRAHQIRLGIRSAAVYHRIPVSTRIIHVLPDKQGKESYQVYFWKRPLLEVEEGIETV